MKNSFTKDIDNIYPSWSDSNTITIKNMHITFEIYGINDSIDVTVRG